MEEILLKVIAQIVAENDANHKFPNGADALSIKRKVDEGVTKYLANMTAKGLLKAYPNVNGIMIYNIVSK